MTPDELEAANHRYLRAYRILPLTSGLYAVYDPAYTLLRICPWEDVRALLSLNYRPEAERIRFKKPAQPQSRLTLADLGF